MAERLDRPHGQQDVRVDAQASPMPDPFGELSTAHQTVVLDLLSVFLGDALGAIRPSGTATKIEGGEQDAAQTRRSPAGAWGRIRRAERGKELQP